MEENGGPAGTGGPGHRGCCCPGRGGRPSRCRHPPAPGAGSLRRRADHPPAGHPTTGNGVDEGRHSPERPNREIPGTCWLRKVFLPVSGSFLGEDSPSAFRLSSNTGTNIHTSSLLTTYFPPSSNACLLILKKRHTLHFQYILLFLFLSCFLHEKSPGEQSLSWDYTIVSTQRIFNFTKCLQEIARLNNC